MVRLFALAPDDSLTGSDRLRQSKPPEAQGWSRRAAGGAVAKRRELSNGADRAGGHGNVSLFQVLGSR